MTEMKIENAIEILSDELDHVRHHLTWKGKQPEYYTELESIATALEMGIEALRKEAHPVREAHWEYSEHQGRQYSRCVGDGGCGVYIPGHSLYRYCPTCGAYMREVQDGD